jgi:hypothetical protein
VVTLEVMLTQEMQPVEIQPQQAAEKIRKKMMFF